MDAHFGAAHAPRVAKSRADRSPVQSQPSTRKFHLHFQAADLRDRLDLEPFGFSHTLHTLELFSQDRLMELVRRFEAAPADYFVSASAPAAGTRFFAVTHDVCTPVEAMQRLNTQAIRILLKRPENHDPDLRRLLDELFGQVLELRRDLRTQRIVRLESGIFITSAASITPFHFDPEVNFFAQIEGEKEYHVYSRRALRAHELEDFYIQGQINIGQVDLRGRDAAHETVFKLRPGDGFHQPQNSPHWVRTQATRSISYAFVYESEQTRRCSRARACNHYLRRIGIDPLEPGVHPLRDKLKSGAMQLVLPARKMLGSKLRALRKRG